MNTRIDIEELKAVLIESIEKKQKERSYQHPLLVYVNYIEAMVKSGARHRDLAQYFNEKLKLEGNAKFDNNRLANVRAYWRKINLIDQREVDRLANEFKNASKNVGFTNELIELKNLYQEVHKSSQKPIDNQDLRNFYRNNKDTGLSHTELAMKYVNQHQQQQ